MQFMGNLSSSNAFYAIIGQWNPPRNSTIYVRATLIMTLFGQTLNVVRELWSVFRDVSGTLTRLSPTASLGDVAHYPATFSNGSLTATTTNPLIPIAYSNAPVASGTTGWRGGIATNGALIQFSATAPGQTSGTIRVFWDVQAYSLAEQGRD